LSVAQRRYFTDVAALTERTVSVITTNGKNFNGTLIGINPDNLSLSLADVKDDSGKLLNRLVINGSAVLSISTAEKPFDLKSLSQRLDKVFPTMVKLYEDKGFIWVMDKVKLTEKGVVEGSGPAADRVQKVYDAFIAEAKA